MIVAIDCDLRQSYAVASSGHAGKGATPLEALAALDSDRCFSNPERILFEIASPVSFSRGAAGHAAMTNLAKWALWNMHWATQLYHLSHRTKVPFLVAPSNVWTKGHKLEVRHAIAGCKQPQKDLRECEAMIYFYNLEPGVWVPIEQYMKSF